FSIYRGIGLTNWYDILNTGYRFPITGASDWPACRFLGDSRTFVHPGSASISAGALRTEDHAGKDAGAPRFPDWLRGAAEGRSFVTSGPMLLLEIDGEKPGAQLKKSGPGPHTVTARLRVRCEVTPVTTVELIVSGEVVQKQTIPPDKQRGQWWEFEHKL